MSVAGRLQTPGVESALADHEARLRAVERSPGGGTGNLEALWWGILPPVATGPAGGVWSVPFINGASASWDIVRTYFRFESAPLAGTYEIELQYSAAGAFVPHAIDDLSLTVGVNEVTHTGAFGTLTSGQLLRVDWLSLGSGAQQFTIQLEGTPV